MDIGQVPQAHQALMEAYLRAHGTDPVRARQALEDVALRGQDSPHSQDVRQAIARAASAMAGVATDAAQALRVMACQDELTLVTDAAQDQGPAEQCHCFCRITHDPTHPGVCVNQQAVATVTYHNNLLGPVEVPLCQDCATQVRPRVKPAAA